MEADAMTKQIATSSESGASASVNNEHGIESFERILSGFQSQLAEFRNEDSVLIGNCPQNVTDDEINKFFCGFATIVKLKRFVYKTLTTNVLIAKFDSSESASRSKVLNTLTLNGKKILLLQPDKKHFFNKKNVVELNGLQEHTEEVIYDHMSTFGNVSFVLKTSTVTYIVYEELSAVESSCRCDYLDQYPVTIRSVLDGPAGCAGGQGSSIETCILEHIDQNSSLLADEEEGQINNFIQLLDMENLDEYLEQDEKEKSSASDKPLLEVGNEEIIVTENETTKNEEEKEADVAAIEKQAFQQTHSQRQKTAGIVLVDNRTKRILNLSGSFLRLTDLPQLSVGVRRVPNKVKIRPKKGSLPSKHKEPKKQKSAVRDSSVIKDIFKASSANMKIQVGLDNLKTKKAEPNLENQKKNKEASSKSDGKSEKEKSKKIHSKTQNPEPATEQKQKKTSESTINENISQPKAEACKKISSNKKNDSEHRSIASITDHKQDPKETLNESKITQEGKNVETGKPEMPKNTSEKTIPNKNETETNILKESKLLPSKKSVFVQLTKLTSKQIQELSQIRRKTVTSHIVVDGEVSNTVKEHDKKIVVKKRKPGPAKGAMKERQVTTETQVVKETTKKAEKRGLSDSEPDSSACLVAKNDTNPISTEKLVETEFVQKKKKSKHEKSAEKPKTVQPEEEPPTQEASTSSSIDDSKSTLTKEPKAQNGSEQNTDDIQQTKTEESNDGKPHTNDQPAVVTESKSEVVQPVLLDEISQPVLDVSNTVEIDQIESVADLESDEERPLVMDISFDTTEENIGQQSQEEPNINRKVVLLDSKSATLLKGSTHNGHFLFIDVLPRVAVKLRQVTASDYIIKRPKEHHRSSSGHIEKPTPKKVSFDSSAVRKKEDKPEKPRKTNLDRIDSKFLPAGSKLKSKIKSKTEINHKKHLPVPELPIELKTHLNTSFKIPKKNSSVKSQSIDRNASELNCLHKEQDESDKQRKRFQKERRPRDGPGGRDRNQNRPEPTKVRQEREPSPTPDFFDPSFDDHSPSPQRIPPTPPPAKEIPSSAPQQTSQRNENQRPPAKNRANKPSFQEIWNISEKKPNVWAKPPWGSSAGGPNTIDSGNTWDSEPVKPNRERNLNTRSNITMDTRTNRSPNAPQSRNTIDSGESWSPGGGALLTKTERPQQSRTINDGETWSPGNQQEQQPQRNMRQDITRSESQQQVQSANTISGGDLWDIEVQPKSTRKLTSPKRSVQQNPLLSGDILDETNELAPPAQFDRRPSNEQHRISPLRKPPEGRRRSRSPFHQRRDRSRSPGRRRRSTDRSPIRRNQSADQSPDRRSFLRNKQSQSPVARQQNLDWRANRSLDQRNFDRDQSPYGRRQPRSPGGLHGNLDKSALRGSPIRMPFRPGRSCSPGPDHTLSSTDVWDFGTSSRKKMIPKQSVADNTLLAGGTWDDEIIPLRGLADRSPPRLRVSVQDHRRQYDLDRISPNDRRHSISHDRLLPDQIHQTFDRPPLREGDNRRWSRDRSPNRRKRSRSRSPSGWNQSMRRSPDKRRRGVGDHSPSYQNMLDYWKAVEDREMEINASSDRPNVERFNELEHTQSPERWMSRATDRDLARGQISDRIDSGIPWANKEHPRHQAMDDSQYSPSSAFDVISSDDECDFTNPRRTANKMSQKSTLPSRESLETIPLIIPSHSQPPNNQLYELPFEATSAIVDHEASRDLFDYKEGEATSSQSQESADDKKGVLENLKQRAEGLKKLEEMKLARQKLLAQISMRKPNTPMDNSEKLDDDRQTHLYQEACASNRQAVLLRNVDSSSQPLLRATAVPGPLLQPPSLSICTPQQFNFALPLPPLPSEAPPPPPPDEPRPPEPDFFNTMIPPPSTSWIPPSSLAPPTLIDVSKPPPKLANPLLNTTSSPQYESDEGESFDNRSNSFKANNIFQPQLTPSNVFDKFRRSQLNREQNFTNTPEDNLLRRTPSEENDFNYMEMQGFNETNNQQRNRDPRPQQQQQQQRGFGGNRPFMRQQQQQQPRRDPRQSHDGNVYGGGQFNRNNNPRNNNRGNNFNNNNQRNNFNNNNAGNNFNFNNRSNNPSNNDPGNNFNFNHPGNNLNNRSNNSNNNNPENNFNSNNPGNNFNNNNSGNDFNDNNPGINFNNSVSIDNFNDNNPGSNFNNDNSGNNFDFDDNPGNNFNNNNNNPGNYFNFNRGARGGGRGRFNNNQQQRFNFQQQTRTQRFNNNRNNEHLQQQQQQQQQPRFLMQQQEMFDESCFDMNELDCNDEGDANNWDDLM